MKRARQRPLPCSFLPDPSPRDSRDQYAINLDQNTYTVHVAETGRKTGLQTRFNYVYLCRIFYPHERGSETPERPGQDLLFPQNVTWGPLYWLSVARCDHHIVLTGARGETKRCHFVQTMLAYSMPFLVPRHLKHEEDWWLFGRGDDEQRVDRGEVAAQGR